MLVQGLAEVLVDQPVEQPQPEVHRATRRLHSTPRRAGRIICCRHRHILPSDDSATPTHCSHVVLRASPYVLVRLRRILGAAPLARPPLLNALATPRMNPKLYQLPLLFTS